MEETKNIEKKKNPFDFANVNSALLIIMAIVSILFCNFWYISLPFGIIAFISSFKKIELTGKTLPKVTIILSVFGITTCAFIYISALLALSQYLFM